MAISVTHLEIVADGDEYLLRYNDGANIDVDLVRYSDNSKLKEWSGEESPNPALFTFAENGDEGLDILYDEVVKKTFDPGELRVNLAMYVSLAMRS